MHPARHRERQGAAGLVTSCGPLHPVQEGRPSSTLRTATAPPCPVRGATLLSWRLTGQPGCVSAVLQVKTLVFSPSSSPFSSNKSKNFCAPQTYHPLAYTTLFDGSAYFIPRLATSGRCTATSVCSYAQARPLALTKALERSAGTACIKTGSSPTRKVRRPFPVLPTAHTPMCTRVYPHAVQRALCPGGLCSTAHKPARVTHALVPRHLRTCIGSGARRVGARHVGMTVCVCVCARVSCR